MKIIIRPAPGLILRKLQTHQVARAIVQATGGAPTCKGDDFITRLRPGSNIIIVSTPHEGTAATLMKIMSLTFHGRSHPVKVYLSTPEDLLKGVVHGIDWTSKQQQQGTPIIAAPKDKGSQQNQRKTKAASPKRTNTKEQEALIFLPDGELSHADFDSDPDDPDYDPKDGRKLIDTCPLEIVTNLRDEEPCVEDDDIMSGDNVEAWPVTSRAHSVAQRKKRRENVRRTWRKEDLSVDDTDWTK
ncbi:hypothetical protein HPB49_003919 [Dermacentor silvarum]|uniref:Uncharacterized protein n=1 Tax=Dermacentor silvarum TaxID=543639 RepID=A0ACB8C777_DERSI|nr:hypothetical protein HPB49_003919 [Dermacentor silvarum]